MQQKRKWVTLPEAAFRLGVAWGRMYAMVLRRELDAKKVGARWYVASDAVEREREKQRGNGRQPGRAGDGAA
jgi:hypothetical protein